MYENKPKQLVLERLVENFINLSICKNKDLAKETGHAPRSNALAKMQDIISSSSIEELEEANMFQLRLQKCRGRMSNGTGR